MKQDLPKQSDAMAQQGTSAIQKTNIYSDMIKSTDGKLKAVGAESAKSATELDSRHILADKEMFTPEELISHLSLRPGMKIADLGCGAGNFVLSIAKRLDSNSEVYGVDVQKDLLIKMLREAKNKNLNNVFAVWADLDKQGSVKLQNSTIDTVLIINTLFQIENKRAAILEAYRILKNNGTLVIVDWIKNGKSFSHSEKQLMEKTELIELVTGNGFLFSNEFLLAQTHFMLKFNKI